MSNENTLIIGVVVLCVLVAGTLLLGGGMFYGGMGGMMGGYSGFGWIFMILIIVLLVLLIVWLFKQIQNPGGRK